MATHLMSSTFRPWVFPTRRKCERGAHCGYLPTSNDQDD